MPKSNDKTRLARAARLAISRHKLVSKLEDIQAKIANLTPLPYISRKLQSGDVSSEWFIQRMLDSGFSMQAALDELEKLRHGPGGENITDIDINSFQSNAFPYTKRIHAVRGTAPSQPSLRFVRNTFAPHLTLAACQCRPNP